MTTWMEQWKADKLWSAMTLFWLITVFASFFGSYLLPVTVPVLGTLYLFRITLPITAALYLVWAIRHGESFWKGTSLLEKWCYVLIVSLLLCGGVSLFRAMDRIWTFRRLFNLCFDLCFFFLMLRLCRDKRIRRSTVILCLVMLAGMVVLGVYEVFFGGIVNPGYNNFKRFFILNHIYQYPVVFTGNTNDYAAMLIFLYAALLLWLLRPGSKHSRASLAWVVVMGIGVYFLALAGNSRLCGLSFFLLLLGIFLYFLLCEKRRLLIPLLLIVGILGVEFLNQYAFIVPPIRQYISRMEEYRAAQSEKLPQEGAVPPDSAPIEKPTLNLGDPGRPTLEEEFFQTDEESGEKVLRNENSSGGIRSILLIHSGKCFLESRGLGVGLGNTETLAAARQLIPQWADKRQNSIHCFLARLIADCGIFALLPLCVIAFLLLKKILLALLTAVRHRDRDLQAYAALFFCALVIFPIASTASSDAQDSISMWIYLASLVLLANMLSAKHAETEEVQHA